MASDAPAYAIIDYNFPKQDRQPAIAGLYIARLSLGHEDG